jgi:acetolactate synthase small subunit
MVEHRWVFVVKVLDKPGTVTAAASVFSNRGVSLEAILGSGINPHTSEDARLVLSFQASERKKDMLMRALQRLSKVAGVDAYRYNDPQLRAIAIAKVSSLENVELTEVQTEAIAQTPNNQTFLLTGSTTAIDQLLDQLRQNQALLDVVLTAIAI